MNFITKYHPTNSVCLKQKLVFEKMLGNLFEIIAEFYPFDYFNSKLIQIKKSMNFNRMQPNVKVFHLTTILQAPSIINISN